MHTLLLAAINIQKRHTKKKKAHLVTSSHISNLNKALQEQQES